MNQEFNNNTVDLAKQKGFYPYEYMSDFEKFKEELPSTEKFYSLLTGRKISDKKYEHVLNVSKKFEMKSIKRLSWLVFKMWCFTIGRCVWKI